jgi:hypothetical protein
MKINTTNLKRMSVIGSLALFTSTGPLFAQQTRTSDSQSSGQQSQSRSMDGVVMNEPAGADNNQERNWGWIGLLGLAGLFGLKQHHENYSDKSRTVRT